MKKAGLRRLFWVPDDSGMTSRNKRGHLIDRIQATSFLMSSSLTALLGGIGTWPHTPTPPFFTFSSSIAWALALPLYLAATSLYAGPTSFLSTAWHAVHA